MSEKDKMLAGELYDANYDKELIKDRYKAKDICFEYNNLKPSDFESKDRIIKKLFAETGKQIIVEQNFWCDYGYNISVGDNFYTNHNCTILDGAKVVFGDNVFIAPNCVFSTAGHAIDSEQRAKGLEIALPITVGDNVWIGANVTVLPGVRIGSNTIIGAGSVVNKDIPEQVIAVGNPCRVLRQITEEDKMKYRMYEA